MQQSLTREQPHTLVWFGPADAASTALAAGCHDLTERPVLHLDSSDREDMLPVRDGFTHVSGISASLHLLGADEDERTPVRAGTGLR